MRWAVFGKNAKQLCKTHPDTPEEQRLIQDTPVGQTRGPDRRGQAGPRTTNTNIILLAHVHLPIHALACPGQTGRAALLCSVCLQTAGCQPRESVGRHGLQPGKGNLCCRGAGDLGSSRLAGQSINDTGEPVKSGPRSCVLTSGSIRIDLLTAMG